MKYVKKDINTTGAANYRTQIKAFSTSEDGYGKCRKPALPTNFTKMQRKEEQTKDIMSTINK